ncbi:MAG TPA: hypothetical protein VJV79_02750 [Polyangiaceae bacterium]|nr:hypothetical protein [Polyangiaceae bacterium]
MPIQISCSALVFAGQKGRKLLVPAAITLSAPVGIPAGTQCRVRVSLLSSNAPGVFSIQAVPGTWNTVNVPGTIASVESAQPFDPNVALPAFTALASYLDNNSLTTPTNGYSATYLVEVINSVPAPLGALEFGMTGSAVPAQSVNVVFAVDHGSSMGRTDAFGVTRLTRLTAALSRGVGLLRDDDTLSVVSFANLLCSNNPQLAADPALAAQQAAATSLASRLTVDTSVPALKCIQMGIDAGRALSQPPSSPPATLVLLTDGVNTNAGGHVLVKPTLPTSALIIGEDPNRIPISATTMVSADGHYAFASAQTLGEFAIEKLLTQVLIGLGGSTFINDPEGSLEPGGSQSFPVQITEADQELEVIVFSNDARTIDIGFTDHGGALAEQGKKGSECDRHLNHEVVRDKGYVITRSPIAPLTPDFMGNPQVVVRRAQAATHRGNAPVRFNLLVVAKTDLMLDAQVTAAGLEVGSDLLFSAVLTEYGRAWTRSGVCVRVDLTHPDGGIQTLELEECSPGRFQAQLRSFRAGAYLAHFIATGKSLLHHRPFRRECLRTVAVFPPRDCSERVDPCALTRAEG